MALTHLVNRTIQMLLYMQTTERLQLVNNEIVFPLGLSHQCTSKIVDNNLNSKYFGGHGFESHCGQIICGSCSSVVHGPQGLVV